MAGIQNRGRNRDTTNKIEQIKTQNKASPTPTPTTPQERKTYQNKIAHGQQSHKSQNQIKSTESSIAKAVIVKKAKTRPKLINRPKSINTPGLTPLGKFGLGIYNTGSDYANILNTDYEDKSILNQAIGHAFEGKWDKAGQVIQNNPYRFAGNLAVEAGSFFIPVGGILKVAKVAKATQKAKHAVMKKIDDSKFITKHLDTAGTPLDEKQVKSVNENSMWGDNYLSPVVNHPNTSMIKWRIKSRINNFKNRNKVIEIVDPQAYDIEIHGFIDARNPNVIGLNPKNLRTAEESVDTILHESIHRAILDGEPLTATTLTNSRQLDNLSYGSNLFRAKTVDAFNVGPLRPEAKMYQHTNSIVDDMTLPQREIDQIYSSQPPGTVKSTRGDIIASQQHGITGLDYISPITKTDQSFEVTRFNDFTHEEVVKDILTTKHDKGLKGNKGVGYYERIFNQKNMELDDAYKLRNVQKPQEAYDPSYMNMAETFDSPNKWREEHVPYQKAKLAKERAKEIKILNQSDQRRNIGLVSAMFVPITASTVSKAKAAVKGTGRRFDKDQSLGGYGRFL